MNIQNEERWESRRHARTIGCVILALVVVAVVWTVGRSWIHALAFNSKKFNDIDTRMTSDEVRAILGPPHRRSRGADGRRVWEYYDGAWIFIDAEYYIVFRDERVEATDEVWW